MEHYIKLIEEKCIMKKQSNLALACSLVCAAGSFWLALTELFSGEGSPRRRAVRFFLWMASSAVWTANLAVDLYERKKKDVTEADYAE